MNFVNILRLCSLKGDDRKKANSSNIYIPNELKINKNPLQFYIYHFMSIPDASTRNMKHRDEI